MDQNRTEQLLTSTAFLAATGLKKERLSAAVAAGRIFCIIGPDNLDYYPAFFADRSAYIRQCLRNVCLSIRNLSACAKYEFYITDSRWLRGGGTPLEAIRAGRVNEVLRVCKRLMQPD